MFYTYIHFKLSDKKPFYVGKGSGRRMYKTKGRNTEWNDIVNKHGFFPEIFSFHLNEEDSFNAERELIETLRNRGEALCNKTSGGQGISGYIQSDDKKKHLSAALIKYFKSNSDAKHIISMFATKRMSDPFERKKVSDGLKKYYANNPHVSEINSLKRKELFNDKPYLLEMLKQQAETQKKGVLCVQENKSFNSISEARDWLIKIGFKNAQTGAISGACKGSRKNYLNFNWQYIN